MRPLLHILRHFQPPPVPGAPWKSNQHPRRRAPPLAPLPPPSSPQPPAPAPLRRPQVWRQQLVQLQPLVKLQDEVLAGALALMRKLTAARPDLAPLLHASAPHLYTYLAAGVLVCLMGRAGGRRNWRMDVCLPACLAGLPSGVLPGCADAAAPQWLPSSPCAWDLTLSRPAPPPPASPQRCGWPPSCAACATPSPTAPS